MASLRLSVDDLLRAAPKPGRASTASPRSLQDVAEDRGWTRRLQEGSRGLTARRRWRRCKANARSHAPRRTVLCATACTIRRPRQPVAARADGPRSRPFAAIAGRCRHRAAHGPAESRLRPRGVRGLALEEGGANSHVAIVAAPSGSPRRPARRCVALAEAGDPIIIDGDLGVHFPRRRTSKPPMRQGRFRAPAGAVPAAAPAAAITRTVSPSRCI